MGTPMRHNASRLAAVMLLMLAAACSTSGKRGASIDPSILGKPNPHVKVGKPYQVNGVWYVPQAEPDYDRLGFASWYGPGFHGRLTANGEVFDENRLTAAHPTLPLPSIVEVTNPKNGKRLKLRVNDRGPFANNRILDLSKEAARQLGTMDAGVATVRVRYIGPARIDDAIVRIGEAERGQALFAELPRVPLAKPVPQNLPTETDVILADLDVSVLDGVYVDPKKPVTPPRDASFFVQLGAYSTTGNAAAAAAKLPSDRPVSLAGANRYGQNLTLVRLGPYEHPLRAQEALEEAKTQGFTEAFIVEEVTR
jgi:rare lipoprotein A